MATISGVHCSNSNTISIMPIHMVMMDSRGKTFQDNIDRLHNTQTTGIHVRIHLYLGATINRLGEQAMEYGKAFPQSFVSKRRH